MSVYDVPNFEKPLCAEVDPEIFFAPDSLAFSGVNARIICVRCEYKTDCAEYSLHNRVLGIWGGLTEYERRIIRKERGIVPKGISSASILRGIREPRRRKS